MSFTKGANNSGDDGSDRDLSTFQCLLSSQFKFPFHVISFGFY